MKQRRRRRPPRAGHQMALIHSIARLRIAPGEALVVTVRDDLSAENKAAVTHLLEAVKRHMGWSALAAVIVPRSVRFSIVDGSCLPQTSGRPNVHIPHEGETAHGATSQAL